MPIVIEFDADAQAHVTKSMLLDWINYLCDPFRLSSQQFRVTPSARPDHLFFRHLHRPVWWCSVSDLQDALPSATRTVFEELIGTSEKPGPLIASLSLRCCNVPDLIAAGYRPALPSVFT